MKTEKLTKDEIDALMDRIRDNSKLDVLFKRLFAIYGLPKWLFEKKPFQDPEFLIGEWENVVASIDEADIMEAANRLFKFRKLQTFPTAAHILAELPEDTKPVEQPKPAYEKPAGLVHCWRKAKVFAVSVGLLGDTDKSVTDEAMNVKRQMTPGCYIWANSEAYRAMRRYLANDPMILDIYPDDITAQITACYDAGVFHDVIAKIRQNIAGEWKPEAPKKAKQKTRELLEAMGLTLNG